MSCRLLSPLAVLLLSACATTVVPGAIPAAELPWLEYDSPESLPYTIRPGDEIEVRFYYTPDLNAAITVQPDGKISLPFAQGITAAGRTPERLAEELTMLYDDQLFDPEIAVVVVSAAGHRVHVGGQVARPGVVELNGPLTVLDAVFQAGGLLDTAYEQQVIVIRERPPRRPRARTAGTADELVGGRFRYIQVDLDALLSEADARQNIALAAGDVIVVPRSPIANVNRWVESYIRNNLPFGVTFGYRIDNPN